MDADNTQLTDQEKLFCELYVNGEAPFGGNAARCYDEAFNDKSIFSKYNANKLLSQPSIREYIESLEKLSYEEARFAKIFLRENLKSIISECSTSTYRDRKGTPISPAALRSVAVSASKALMELYPVKEAQTSKLSIEGAGEGGITFNVIMPNTDKKDE